MPVLDPKKPHQRHFEAISAIPRASTKEKAVSDYVVSVAREQGLEVRQDELWNVVVRKPATLGLEHAEPVMLQAHLDMVCVKSPESTHNFDTDPLELYVENGHIRARGTTLGADDGYGVAYLLALMEDDDFPHPPLELVFTSQEENGCWGARGLDMSDIRARRMIGLDVMESDRENVCCVSCFCSDKMTLGREVHPVPAEGTALRLTVDGIQPIREGAQVHPELYNAIKLTARVLSDILSAGISFRLVSMRGGEAENYNPVACESVIVTKDPDSFRARAEQLLKRFAQEIEDGRQSTRLAIEETDSSDMLSAEDTRAILDSILLVPANTVTIDQRTQEMTSYCCVGMVEVDSQGFALTMSDRAKSDSYRQAIASKLGIIARLTGCHLTIEERYAPWTYNPDSVMLKKTAALMKEVYGAEMIESICPGGLEACDFLPKIPDMDIVMFAPIGDKCHSTEEFLDLASFDRVYLFVKQLLSSLAE